MICRGITKKEKRCKNYCKNKYCHLHKKTKRNKIKKGGGIKTNFSILNGMLE